MPLKETFILPPNICYLFLCEVSLFQVVLAIILSNQIYILLEISHFALRCDTDQLQVILLY